MEMITFPGEEEGGTSILSLNIICASIAFDSVSGSLNWDILKQLLWNRCPHLYTEIGVSSLKSIKQIGHLAGIASVSISSSSLAILSSGGGSLTISSLLPLFETLRIKPLLLFSLAILFSSGFMESWWN